MRRAAVAAVLAVGLVGAGTGACGPRDEGDEAAEALVSREEEVEALDPDLTARLPAGTTFAMAEEGRRLFLVCAVCHGTDAGGTALGPALDDGEWIQGTGTLEEIEAVIRQGVPESQEFPIPMPVLGGGDFDDAEVRSLATYVYVLGRAEP